MPSDDINNDGTVNGSDLITGSRMWDGVGGYVDLGNGYTGGQPLFASPTAASASSLGGTSSTRRTYCTWSTHYEANGIDEDDGGSGPVDEGTDGLDSDSNSLVDDAAEQETSPPYPYPLRGLEVRIRVYEPSSRQVRQVTVRHSFVPH